MVDPNPKSVPAPEAVSRAVDVLKSAEKPLIIIGKGAAYAQCDDTVRELVETLGFPYLPMSMAKGLLPDNHPQCASAARSLVPAFRSRHHTEMRRRARGAGQDGIIVPGVGITELTGLDVQLTVKQSDVFFS